MARRPRPAALPLDFDGIAEGLCIAGVDEVGRGPLAGPVVAAAVILDPARPIAGLDDSKRLTAARRERLDVEIRSGALAFAFGRAEATEVDALNVLQASMLAMQRAVAGLVLRPAHVFVDGNRTPSLPVPATAIVGGDGRVAQIAAASILAKVARDAEMVALESVHPGYGFDRHKGYPSPQHLEALGRLGVTPQHRRSFGPVRALLDAAERLAGGSPGAPPA
ncbi:MAG TPA: ribonuclease HII [Pseudomonadales bacterium]|nr:ribonuclease HII [Pseudomonadales bacterium]